VGQPGPRDRVADIPFGGRADLTIPLPFPPAPIPVPYTPESFVDTITAALTEAIQLPAYEAAYFARKLLVYVASSDERRLGQWDNVTWNDFIHADKMSQEYRRVFVGADQCAPQRHR
jgi:hypothetical protein